jgi:hypothetical protein
MKKEIRIEKSNIIVMKTFVKRKERTKERERSE